MSMGSSFFRTLTLVLDVLYLYSPITALVRICSPVFSYQQSHASRKDPINDVLE